MSEAVPQEEKMREEVVQGLRVRYPDVPDGHLVQLSIPLPPETVSSVAAQLREENIAVVSKQHDGLVLTARAGANVRYVMGEVHKAMEKQKKSRPEPAEPTGRSETGNADPIEITEEITEMELRERKDGKDLLPGGYRYMILLPPGRRFFSEIQMRDLETRLSEDKRALYLRTKNKNVAQKLFDDIQAAREEGNGAQNGTVDVSAAGQNNHTAPQKPIAQEGVSGDNMQVGSAEGRTEHRDENEITLGFKSVYGVRVTKTKGDFLDPNVYIITADKEISDEVFSGFFHQSQNNVHTIRAFRDASIREVARNVEAALFRTDFDAVRKKTEQVEQSVSNPNDDSRTTIATVYDQVCAEYDELAKRYDALDSRIRSRDVETALSNLAKKVRSLERDVTRLVNADTHANVQEALRILTELKNQKPEAQTIIDEMTRLLSGQEGRLGEQIQQSERNVQEQMQRLVSELSEKIDIHHNETLVVLIYSLRAMNVLQDRFLVALGLEVDGLHRAVSGTEDRLGAKIDGAATNLDRTIQQVGAKVGEVGEKVDAQAESTRQMAEDLSAVQTNLKGYDQKLAGLTAGIEMAIREIQKLQQGQTQIPLGILPNGRSYTFTAIPGMVMMPQQPQQNVGVEITAALAPLLEQLAAMQQQQTEMFERMMTAQTQACKDQMNEMESRLRNEFDARIKEKDDEIARLKQEKDAAATAATAAATAAAAELEAQKTAERNRAEQMLRIAHDAVEKLENQPGWKRWLKTGALIAGGLGIGALAATGIGAVGLAGFTSMIGAGAVSGGLRGWYKHHTETNTHNVRLELSKAVAQARAAGVDFDRLGQKYKQYEHYSDNNAPGSRWGYVLRNALAGAGLATAGGVIGAYLMGGDEALSELFGREIDTHGFLNPIPDVPPYPRDIPFSSLTHTVWTPDGMMFDPGNGSFWPVPHGFENVYADSMFDIGNSSIPFSPLEYLDPTVANGTHISDVADHVLNADSLYGEMLAPEEHAYLQDIITGYLDPNNSELFINNEVLSKLGIDSISSNGVLHGIGGRAVDFSALFTNPDLMREIAGRMGEEFGPATESLVSQILHNVSMNLRQV